MPDRPQIRKPTLIVYSYTLGKGVEEDPIRTVQCIGTTDGELVVEKDSFTNEVRVGQGFWYVLSGECDE